MGGKGANGITETKYDLIQRGKDFISEAAFAEFLPDLFNRIHFWRIRRNKKQPYIFRNAERSGLMPGSTIAAKEDDVVRVLF